LTFVRTFDYKVLDMLELYVDPETFRPLQSFKNKKPAVGLKPMISFHGTVFESPTETKYTLAKSLLLDFFRGQETNEVDVSGLQYLISISAEEEEEGQPAPKIHLRSYLIKTKRSGQKLPRVEVEEMGPRLDFAVGRERFPDADMLKDALKKPKGVEARTKKNIDMDIMGDKVGKIHVGKQDFSTMQTRKMKGLKRSRDALVEGSEDDDADTMVDADEGGVELPTTKKSKA
jgi:ribosome production factor 2